MKNITSGYKENVKLFGREIDSKITFTLNNEQVVLGAEELNSVSLHYEGTILKSVMKQLDIDSSVEIPLETEINYQFGVKVNNSYEYIDHGQFIVYNVEKQEDTRSYKITCYDKMLYSMKEYESLNVTYPITIRDYLIALCDRLGLDFANETDTFVNYDKTISGELYLDADGNNLDYTYRDVLDELSAVTASIICINSDDELEIRYMNDTEDTIDEEYLKDVNVKFGEKFGPVNSVVLSRAGESDNIYENDEQSIEDNGLCEIKIIDNQILNGNNRDVFLQDIFTELNGFEYYINDYSSTGITYYDIFDKYYVQIGENTYSCIMFNDEINVTQGLEEQIHADKLEGSETDYTKADKTDRRINQAYIIVDKQNQEINSVIQTINQLQNLVNENGEQVEALGTRITQTVNNITASVTTIQNELDNGVNLVKTTSVTIDDNGLNVSTDNSKIATTMSNDAFKIMAKGSEDPLAFFGYDTESNSTKAQMDNLTVTNYFVAGYHRTEKMDVNGENRTGVFYIGG